MAGEDVLFRKRKLQHVVDKRTKVKVISASKTDHIEKSVAYHLGQVKRDFESGVLDEDLIENIDETNFVIIMDNGGSLGFAGDDNVKYADVVSGGEGITMIVRLTGGKRAQIETPFLIFINKSRNYPLRNLPDDVPGVWYRISPKGFIDGHKFVEYFKEKRANYRTPGDNQPRTIFLDQCSGHDTSVGLTEAVSRLRASLKYFPGNATDFVQPADSFIIPKIKQTWSSSWNQKKIEMIQANKWQDKVRSDGSWSGKLPNPGTKYFLKLAAESVRAVNAQRDETCINFTRKAMIRCGLAKDIDGHWRVSQLSKELQMIVQKYPEHFTGTPVPDSAGAASESRDVTSDDATN